MKKNKMKDTTKFIIALSICLALICTSIVFASVFSRQEDSAKAESVAEREIIGFSQYSLPLNEWSASGFMYVRSSSESYIDFTALAQYGSLRTPRNFTFKANNKYLLSFYLEASGVPNGSLQISVNNEVREIGYFLEPYEIANCVGNKRLFTYIFTPVEVGGSSMMIIYDNSTYGFVNYEMSFLNLFNMSDIFGEGYEPTTADEFFRYIASNQNYPFYNDIYIDSSIGLYDQLFSESAYNKGYSDGLLVGTTDAKYGIFNGASFTTTFIKEDQSTDVVTGIQPVLNNSTLSWENVYDYWFENYFEIENIDNVIVKINFAQSFDFVINPIYVRVDSDVTDFAFNDRYTASWNYLASSITNADTLLTLNAGQNAPDTFQVTSLSIYFGRVADTLATGYINATNDSYNQGRQVGFLEGFDEGVANGNPQREDEMYNLGYSRGVASAGDYTFLGLMGAVVDAPIQAVMKMFDFNILGMNMRGLYLSLFTLCLVITIIKFVLVK